MPRRGFGRENIGNVGNQLVENVSGQLGAIFTLKPQAKYMTGARCVLRVNGNIIGFAFAVSWSVRTDAVEINTIDDPLPWEIAPTRITVSGTLGLFQIPGESPQANLIQSDIGSFLANRYITLEVKDTATDTIIFRTNSAVVIGQDSSLSAEQMGQTTLQWRAIGWQVETAPAVFSDEDLEKNPNDLGGGLSDLKSAMDKISSVF